MFGTTVNAAEAMGVSEQAGAYQGQGAYMNVRRDMMLFDPAEVSSVLDVGCYTGATGAYLKSVNPALRLVGLDVVEEALHQARSIYGEAHLVDLDRPGALSCLGGAKFDVILLGDVLEHLKTPEAALTVLADHLSLRGRIICSLPNIQFWEAIATIVVGRFPRRPAGIFDHTHLRFFTKHEALALFAAANTEVVSMRRSIRLIECRRLLFLNRLVVVLKPLLWLFAPYFTYQFVFVLRAKPTAA
jgi:2-polyprenyl-3-methyl-5-hydroxy-6-metoxy-1,4-benzoquinol methylase